MDLSEQYAMYAELLNEVKKHQDMLSQRLEDRIGDMYHSMIQVVVEMREVQRNDGNETRNYLDAEFARLSPRQDNSINSFRPAVKGDLSQRPKHSGVSFPQPPGLAITQDVPIMKEPESSPQRSEPETEISTPDQDEKVQSLDQSPTMYGTSASSAVSNEKPSQIEMQSKPFKPSLTSSFQQKEYYCQEMSTDILNPFDPGDHVDDHENHEPPVLTCWHRWKQRLTSTGFDLLVGAFIMLNAVMMGIELEWQGSTTATEMGIEVDTEDWPAAKLAFFLAEHAFTLIFIIELIIRLATLGCAFFRKIANLLDFGIVVLSVLDLYIMSALGLRMPNVTFLRLLRIIKLIRALKVIRQMRPFRHLRVLATAMWGARGALMWSICLLAFIHFIFAILFTQSLQTFLRDDSEDIETRKEVYDYFGTLSRSLLTMFEMTLAPGTWATIGRVVIYKVSRVYTIVFVAYVYTVTFGVMKVITALFLKETLSAAGNDQDMIIEEKVQSQNSLIRSLRSLFKKMDLNDSGSIGVEELNLFLDDPRSAAWFQILDVHPPELQELLHLTDDGDEQISLEKFCQCILRLRGSAKTLDLIKFKHSQQQKLNDVFQEIRTLSATLMQALGQSSYMMNDGRTPL